MFKLNQRNTGTAHDHTEWVEATFNSLEEAVEAGQQIYEDYRAAGAGHQYSMAYWAAFDIQLWIEDEAGNVFGLDGQQCERPDPLPEE